MKKTLTLVALLIISASLQTCELDDVDVPVILEITFHADEDGDGTNVAYYDVQMLDLTGDPDVKPYLSKIKDIEITKITYRIMGYQEDPTANPPCTNVIVTDGFAKFGKVGTVEETFLGNFAAEASSVNLQSITTETELDIDPEQFDALADLLRHDKKVNIISVGTLSCTPIKFDVVAKFYATVTADAIE